MSSLVLELQSDCLNPGAGVSDLLRKALVIAKKLNVAERDAWIQNELNGYRGPESVPPYRVVRTEVEAVDQWGRWIPVLFRDNRTLEVLSTIQINDSTAEIEALLERSTSAGAGRISKSFTPEQLRFLMRDSMDGLMPSRFVRPEDLHGILDAVRNEILTWCLKLEKDGILGVGMTFSKEEQQKAAASQYTTTFNIGTMTQSQIQNATSASSQVLSKNTFASHAAANILRELRAHIDEIGLTLSQRKEIDRETTAVETQMAAPTPNYGIIQEAFRSIRNVLEGTTGSLIASGLIYEIGRLLSR